MSVLDITLFGPPRAERDGVPVSFHRHQTLALLAYLAATDQPHSRDALATLFWPQQDEQQAHAALRRILFDLGRTIGKGWLALRGPSRGPARAAGAGCGRPPLLRADERASPPTAMPPTSSATTAWPPWPKLPASTGTTSWPASRSKDRRSSTPGRPSPPRACAWSWLPRWRSWPARSWPGARSSGRCPTRGAGWRWTRSTRPATAC